jgi:phosphoglycerate kinase
MEKGAKIIILTHLGRPQGRDLKWSTQCLLPALERILKTEVAFLTDLVGPESIAFSRNLLPGQVALAENVRFYAGESINDSAFARSLAELGDFYVNDAFSASHRAHATTCGLAHILPCAAGILMTEELIALEKALGNPKRPLMAIVGGSKVSTKLRLLNNLVTKVNHLVVGGGMANTFLLAEGKSIGFSLAEPDLVPEVKHIVNNALLHRCNIIIPHDVLVQRDNGFADTAHVDHISNTDRILDFGPESVEQVINVLKTCSTVVWNGPVGMFEQKPFDTGTQAIAMAIAAQTQQRTLLSIAGGGDTVAALNQAGCGHQFTYVSTAGGAFLEWMEGDDLPGVLALDQGKPAT